MSKRIKVLFTTSNFNTAGSGKVIYDLVNGLDKSKFEIEIACEDKKGQFFSSIETLGVPIHIYRTKTNYRPYYSLFFRIRPISKFLSKQQYDIVHSWQWTNDWTETIASRMAGAKWIYTKKAMGFKSRHWAIKSYLANFIVTINEEMQSYFPKKKAQKLIPLGINTDYYSPKDFSKNSTAIFRVVTVANLVRVKGVEILIKALSSIKQEFEFTIVGDCNNKYGEEMKSLVHDLGLDNKVNFIGKKPDVRPYLAQSDLYVIPTLNEGRKEGMPMALVEAMSMETFVLGSNISGINYVLKDFEDLLFEAGNVKELNEKISKVMNCTGQERQKVEKSLRQYCISNFSMPKFITAHEQLYKTLVNS